MPTAQVRGVEIVYQIIGDHGPWFALSTGGRRSHNEFVSLAKKLPQVAFESCCMIDAILAPLK